MADLTLSVGFNAANLQAAINSVVNRTYTLGAINTGRTQQALGRITGSASEFEKSMDAANARVLAFGASAGAIYIVKKAFETLITSTIDVETKLTEINSIFGLSSKQLSSFSSEIFSAANSVSVSFSDASKAALEFSRQGLSVEETLKRTRDSLILARVAGMDFTESASAITAALNSFSNELIKSTDLVDRLTNADANFAVSAGDLAEAIKRVGSSASDSNVTLNQTIALVTAAQQITSRGGAVIGNSFKTIFTRLGRSSVLGDLENLGIATKNASGDTLPLVQILKNLASTYDSLSSSQKNYAAELVGGVYQINILKATVSDLGKSGSVYEAALKTIENSTGSAEKRIDQLNQTISAKLNVTLNKTIQLASAIGSKTIAPIFKGVLDNASSGLGSIADSIDGEGIGSKIAGGMLGGIKGLLQGPGAALFGFFATKLAGNFGSFLSSSISSFAGINTAAQQQAQIQKQIVTYLQSNPTLLQSIHLGTMSISQAHGVVLGQIRAQNALLSYQNQIATQISSRVFNSGVRVGPTRVTPAAGFIPNFNSQEAGQMMENAGAREHGYTAGRAYPTTVHDGNGNSFPTFVNSRETVKTFTNSEGNKATMVTPPNGFGKGTMRAARGFVPNFSLLKKDKGGNLILSQEGAVIPRNKEFDNVADQGLDTVSGLKYNLVEYLSKSKLNKGYENALKNRNSTFFQKYGRMTQAQTNLFFLNLNSGKPRVTSLKDSSKTAPLEKQKSGVKSTVIGELYERSIAGHFNLKRSVNANDRLDFSDAGAEAKSGIPDSANLLAKAIVTRAKVSNKKNLPYYRDKVLDKIDLSSTPLALYTTTAAAGFVPNFANVYRGVDPKYGDTNPGGRSIGIGNKLVGALGSNYTDNKDIAKVFGSEVISKKVNEKKLLKLNEYKEVIGLYQKYQSMLSPGLAGKIKNSSGEGQLALIQQAGNELRAVLKKQKFSGIKSPLHPADAKYLSEEKGLVPGNLIIPFAGGFVPNFAEGEIGEGARMKAYKRGEDVFKAPKKTGSRRGEAIADAKEQEALSQQYSETLSKFPWFKVAKQKHVGGGVLKQPLVEGQTLSKVLRRAYPNYGERAISGSLGSITKFLNKIGLPYDGFGLAGNIIIPEEHQKHLIEVLQKEPGNLYAKMFGHKGGFPEGTFQPIDFASGFVPNFARVLDFDGTLGTAPEGITHKDTYHGWSASKMIPTPLVDTVRKEQEASRKAGKPIEDIIVTARGRESIPYINEWLKNQGLSVADVRATGDKERYPEGMTTPNKKVLEIKDAGMLKPGTIFSDDDKRNLTAAKRAAKKEGVKGFKTNLANYGNQGIGQMAGGHIPNFGMVSAQVSALNKRDARKMSKAISGENADPKRQKQQEEALKFEELSALAVGNKMMSDYPVTSLTSIPTKDLKGAAGFGGGKNFPGYDSIYKLLTSNEDLARILGVQINQPSYVPLSAKGGSNIKIAEIKRQMEKGGQVISELKKNGGLEDLGVGNSILAQASSPAKGIPELFSDKGLFGKPGYVSRIARASGGFVPNFTRSAAEKIQVLERLSKQGVGGEAVNAQAALDRIRNSFLEKHEKEVRRAARITEGFAFNSEFMNAAGGPNSTYASRGGIKEIGIADELRKMVRGNRKGVLGFVGRNSGVSGFAGGFVPNFASIYNPQKSTRRGLGGIKGEDIQFGTEERTFIYGNPEESQDYYDELKKLGIVPGRKITESGSLGLQSVNGEKIQAHRGTSREEVKNLIKGQTTMGADITNNQNIARSYALRSASGNARTGAHGEGKGKFGSILHMAGLEESGIERTRRFGTATAGNIALTGEKVKAYSKIKSGQKFGGTDDSDLMAFHKFTPGGSLAERFGTENSVHTFGQGPLNDVYAGDTFRESLPNKEQSFKDTQGELVDFQKVAARFWSRFGKKLEAQGIKKPDWVRSVSPMAKGASHGFVPNFNALKDAVGRERAAGYSASQIRIGSSKSLVTSSNPGGMGVYNSTERSLAHGISLATGAGIEPKTKGASRGFIPNFAEDSSGTGIATLTSVLLGSIGAMRQNTLALRESARVERASAQAQRMATTGKGPLAVINEKLSNQLSSLSSKDLEAFRANSAAFNRTRDVGDKIGFDISSTRAKNDPSKQRDYDALIASKKQVEQSEKSRNRSNIAGTILSSAPAAIAGSMEEGPNKAAMEAFSEASSVAGAALMAFPGRVGAVIAGLIVIPAALRAAYLAFYSVAQPAKLAASIMKEINKTFESAGQEVVKAYQTYQDAIYNTSISALEISKLNREVANAMQKIPDSLRSEFSTRMKLATSQEERSRIYNQMNQDLIKNQEVTETLAKSQEGAESIGQGLRDLFMKVSGKGKENRYTNTTFFAPNSADLAAQDRKITSETFSVIGAVTKTDSSTAAYQEALKGGTGEQGIDKFRDSIAKLLPPEAQEAFRAASDSELALMRARMRVIEANKKLEAMTAKVLAPSIEAERARKKQAQEEINVLREKSASLHRLAGAFTTMGIGIAAIIKAGKIEGQTKAFSSLAGAEKRGVGLQTQAVIDARTDRVAKDSSAMQQLETANAKSYEDALQRGGTQPGQENQPPRLSEAQRAANLAIKDSLRDTDTTGLDPRAAREKIEKNALANAAASGVAGAGREVTSKMNDPQLIAELAKNEANTAAQLQVNKNQEEEQRKAGIALAKIEQNSKAFGGIENFLDKSKARADSKDFNKSLKMAGSRNEEKSGRGSLKVLLAAQKDLGGSLSKEAGGALQDAAINARAKNIEKEADKRIRSIGRSKLPPAQKQALIGAYKDAKSKSKEMARIQVEEAAKLERAPLEQLKKLDIIAAGFRELNKALTGAGIIIKRIDDPSFFANQSNSATAAAKATDDQIKDSTTREGARSSGYAKALSLADDTIKLGPTTKEKFKGLISEKFRKQDVIANTEIAKLQKEPEGTPEQKKERAEKILRLKEEIKGRETVKEEIDYGSYDGSVVQSAKKEGKDYAELIEAQRASARETDDLRIAVIALTGVFALYAAGKAIGAGMDFVKLISDFLKAKGAVPSPLPKTVPPGTPPIPKPLPGPVRLPIPGAPPIPTPPITPPPGSASDGIIAKIAAKFPSLAPAINSVGNVVAKLGPIAPMLGAVAKKLPLIGAGIGGIVGYMEAEETGRSKLGATTLGVLTGSASTGSGLAQKFGAEKGGVVDRGAGYAGAALQGATLGGVIGSFIAPGIGTAIGAAIGAGVGLMAEGYKHYTEKDRLDAKAAQGSATQGAATQGAAQANLQTDRRIELERGGFTPKASADLSQKEREIGDRQAQREALSARVAADPTDSTALTELGMVNEDIIRLSRERVAIEETAMAEYKKIQEEKHAAERLANADKRYGAGYGAEGIRKEDETQQSNNRSKTGSAAQQAQMLRNAVAQQQQRLDMGDLNKEANILKAKRGNAMADRNQMDRDAYAARDADGNVDETYKDTDEYKALQKEIADLTFAIDQNAKKKNLVSSGDTLNKDGSDKPKTEEEKAQLDLTEGLDGLKESIVKLTDIISSSFPQQSSSNNAANGGLLNGPSHANGGIAMMHRSGKQIAEAEGGEWVVNKRDSKKSGALLSRINAGEEFAMAGRGMLIPKLGNGGEAYWSASGGLEYMTRGAGLGQVDGRSTPGSTPFNAAEQQAAKERSINEYRMRGPQEAVAGRFVGTSRLVSDGRSDWATRISNEDFANKLTWKDQDVLQRHREYAKQHNFALSAEEAALRQIPKTQAKSRINKTVISAINKAEKNGQKRNTQTGQKSKISGQAPSKARATRNIDQNSRRAQEAGRIPSSKIPSGSSSDTAMESYSRGQSTKTVDALKAGRKRAEEDARAAQIENTDEAKLAMDPEYVKQEKARLTQSTLLLQRQRLQAEARARFTPEQIAHAERAARGALGQTSFTESEMIAARQRNAVPSQQMDMSRYGSVEEHAARLRRDETFWRAGVTDWDRARNQASMSINGMQFGGLLNGPSHANGGIAMMHRSGKQIAEAEGGEWVVNKRDSKKSGALLSRINAGEEFAMAGRGMLIPKLGNGGLNANAWTHAYGDSTILSFNEHAWNKPQSEAQRARRAEEYEASKQRQQFAAAAPTQPEPNVREQTPEPSRREVGRRVPPLRGIDRERDLRDRLRARREQQREASPSSVDNNTLYESDYQQMITDEVNKSNTTRAQAGMTVMAERESSRKMTKGQQRDASPSSVGVKSAQQDSGQIPKTQPKPRVNKTVISATNKAEEWATQADARAMKYDRRRDDDRRRGIMVDQTLIEGQINRERQVSQVGSQPLRDDGRREINDRREGTRIAELPQASQPPSGRGGSLPDGTRPAWSTPAPGEAPGSGNYIKDGRQYINGFYYNRQGIINDNIKRQDAQKRALAMQPTYQPTSEEKAVVAESRRQAQMTSSLSLEEYNRKMFGFQRDATPDQEMKEKSEKDLLRADAASEEKAEKDLQLQQRSLQFGGELADRGKQIEMPNRQQNASVSRNSSAQQDEAAQSQAAANFQIDFLERSGAVQTAKLSLPNAETLDAFKEAMVAKMNQQGQKIETQGRGLSNLNGSIHPPARL